jgi:hypothetical protein
MENEILGAHEQRALHFGAEGGDGARTNPRVCGGEIDQIVVVDYEGVQVEALPQLPQTANLLGLRDTETPRSGTAGKDLEGIGAQLRRADCCPVQRAGNRSVNSDAQSNMVSFRRPANGVSSSRGSAT